MFSLSFVTQFNSTLLCLHILLSKLLDWSVDEESDTGIFVARCGCFRLRLGITKVYIYIENPFLIQAEVSVHEFNLVFCVQKFYHHFHWRMRLIFGQHFSVNFLLLNLYFVLWCLENHCFSVCLFVFLFLLAIVLSVRNVAVVALRYSWHTVNAGIKHQVNQSTNQSLTQSINHSNSCCTRTIIFWQNCGTW